MILMRASQLPASIRAKKTSGAIHDGQHKTQNEARAHDRRRARVRLRGRQRVAQARACASSSSAPGTSSSPRSPRPTARSRFRSARRPKGILDLHVRRPLRANPCRRATCRKSPPATACPARAEEYAAIMRRSLSVFGTYTVDEAKKTVTFKIVSIDVPEPGRARRRRAPSTSSPPTNSSTPTRTWPAGAARRRNFYKRREIAGQGRSDLSAPRAVRERDLD